jgi:hypothetical protein
MVSRWTQVRERHGEVLEDQPGMAANQQPWSTLKRLEALGAIRWFHLHASLV